MDTVFTFDWIKVYPEVLAGLQDGTVCLRDGVAYWTKLAEKSGIVQHIPLKASELDPEEIKSLASNVQGLAKLTQGAHATQLAAIGLSTGLIVGAIVIQTAYLSRKIDKLQTTIDLVSHDVDSKNVIDFMGKISEYFGVVESARQLLLDKALVSETQDVAAQLITLLSIKRNEIMSLVDNLIAYADQVSDRHLSHILDFINTMLDSLPKAIFVEAQLCDRYGKFRFAAHIVREGRLKYDDTLSSYRAWCNSRVQSVIAGKSDPAALCFQSKEADIKQLLISSINQPLLQDLIQPQLELHTACA